MGMDMYVDICKPDPNDKKNILERKEWCYWRKFWGLHHALPFHYGDEEYGKDIHLTKKDLECILEFATHNRDYFNGFSTVEQICELLDQYDELKEDGWVVVYNANW